MIIQERCEKSVIVCAIVFLLIGMSLPIFAQEKKLILKDIPIDPKSISIEFTISVAPGGRPMLEWKPGLISHPSGGYVMPDNLLYNDAIHRFKGRVKGSELDSEIKMSVMSGQLLKIPFKNFKGGFSGYIFEGDKKDPLTFRCVYRKGYVHIGGKGRVIMKDGREIKLGGDDSISETADKKAVEGKAAVLETQPPSKEVIVGAIEKEVLNKFPIQKYCAGMVITSNKLIIDDIKIIEYNKEGQYWKVEASPKCDMGSVVAIPRRVFSFDFFKVYKDSQGDWQAELVMRK